METCSSKDGKFIATVQLCIILNNMQAIKDKLSPPDLPPSEPKPVGIIDELGLQEFFDWLEQEKGIGLKMKEFVNTIMNNAADDIHHKICIVTVQLGKQVILILKLTNTFTFVLLYPIPPPVRSSHSAIHGRHPADMWWGSIC